ncbi:MAG: hypothetical protein PHD72_01635 [Patescibacteria group bacterium]|nr:hypothetical protein [Patescibacteria group bacterium]
MTNGEKIPVNPYVENRAAAQKAEATRMVDDPLEKDSWVSDEDIEKAMNFLLQLPEEAREAELNIWRGKNPKEAAAIETLLKKRAA